MEYPKEYKIIFEKISEIKSIESKDESFNHSIEISDEVKILRKIVDDISSAQEPVTFTRS